MINIIAAIGTSFSSIALLVNFFNSSNKRKHRSKFFVFFYDVV